MFFIILGAIDQINLIRKVLVKGQLDLLKIEGIQKKSLSRGLVKSRQKIGRDSRSRETDGGEKIAVTNTYILG